MIPSAPGPRCDLLDRLSQPSIYIAVVDRLYAKAWDKGRVSVGRRGGVSLTDLVHDAGAFCRLLAREIARGAYAPQPAVRRRIRADKQRDVLAFSLPDLVVHGALAQLLTAAMEPYLSPHLYSYRQGRSAAQAVRGFARYVRAHRAERPDPRTRGLFVVRADVRDYGESIPVGAGSALWPMLSRVLGPLSAPAIDLLTSAVTPAIAEATSPGAAGPGRGLPVGSPVATALSNLYLDPLDRALGAIGAGFYSRFGDDILFAHPDLDRARGGGAAIEQILGELGLSIHATKFRFEVFNGAGRRSEQAPDLAATTRVVYLGSEITFSGEVSLPRHKLADVRSALRRRISRSASALADSPCDARGRAVCAAVNRALSPGTPLSIPHADALRSLVTNRAQLRELDRWIATAIAKALAGRKGVRALRTIPPRVLRKWALMSLVHRRNVGREAT